MAQTPEGRVKDWLYGTRQKPGQLYKTFEGPIWLYKPPGGMFGSAGTPDCLFVWRGVFVGLEVKAEDGKPTALQLKSLRAIRDAGGVAAIIVGKDNVRLLQIYAAVMAKVRHDTPSTV